MGQKRNRLDACELGDWADWDLYPSDKDQVYGSQRSIHDFQEVDGKLRVMAAKEWTFRKDIKDDKKVWLCVNIGRCE